MALSLAKPSFVVGPKETLAAVDVYDQVSSTVLNSYQDAQTEGSDLLSSVTNALKGIDVKSILATAQNGLATAARLSQAYNQLKSGYISGALGGVSSLARMAGGSGIMSLATKALGVAGIIQGGGRSNISKILNIGGIALGGDGASLTKLASTYTALQRQTASLGYGFQRGDMSYSFNAGSSLAGLAGRALSDMDMASQINFKAAAASTFNLNPETSNGLRLSKSSQATGNAISSAMYDLTDGKYTTTINDRAGMAGMISGLTLAGSKIGMNDVFGTFAANVQDKQLLTIAARPLMSEAANLGDAGLFRSIASVPAVARELSSHLPGLTRKMAANVLPSETLAQSHYGAYYSELKGSLNAVDNKWNTANRGGQSVLNTAFTSQNDFMTDMMSAHLNSDTSHLTQLLSSVDGEAATQVTKVEIADEAFMVMGSQFKDFGTAESLQMGYPEFYDSLDEDPQEVFV